MTHHVRSYFLILLSMIRGSHIPGIRQVRKLSLSINRQKYAIAALACAYVRMLAEDDAKRSEFYREPFWDGLQRFHREKDLLHVLMYLENARAGDENYKLASAHAQALQQVCDDTNIADEDLAQHIEQNGGFSGLSAADADSDCEARRDGTTVSILSEDNDELADTDDQPAQDDESPSDNEDLRRPVRKAPKPVVTLKRLPWSYVRGCVLARMSPAVRAAVLQALRDGKSVRTKLVPGDSMDEYELYAGGGAFIEVTIDEYSVEAR